LLSQAKPELHFYTQRSEKFQELSTGFAMLSSVLNSERAVQEAGEPRD
jgi:hypothetical protein